MCLCSVCVCVCLCCRHRRSCVYSDDQWFWQRVIIAHRQPHQLSLYPVVNRINNSKNRIFFLYTFKIVPLGCRLSSVSVCTAFTVHLFGFGCYDKTNKWNEAKTKNDLMFHRHIYVLCLTSSLKDMAGRLTVWVSERSYGMLARVVHTQNSWYHTEWHTRFILCTYLSQYKIHLYTHESCSMRRLHAVELVCCVCIDILSCCYCLSCSMSACDRGKGQRAD